jgi:hypothetical protein
MIIPLPIVHDIEKPLPFVTEIRAPAQHLEQPYK